MSILSLFLFIVSFIGIWAGAGMIIASADRFAKKLRLSAFSLSFFVLGILTSIPEFSVGMTAIAENKPDIFVGNLIGGIPVIFFLIIPLLAIFGNSINLNHAMTRRHMIVTFAVILFPTMTLLDGKVTTVEGIIAVLLYAVLFIIIEREKGVFDTGHSNVLNLKKYSLLDIMKVLLGVGLVFISSHFIVEGTLNFATVLQVSPFYVSILFLAIGTNLPELSLAVRSVLSGNKDVAFGDYMGSASANTFFFGLFTLLHGGEVIAISNFYMTFIILFLGLVIFYHLTREKNAISRNDAFFLLIVYIVFIAVEHML